MKKTYLELALEKAQMTQAEFARRMGWKPQRVNYLCSADVVNFPFDQLWIAKKVLGLTDDEQAKVLSAYFSQSKR